MKRKSSLGMKLVRSTAIILTIMMLVGIAWNIYREKKQANMELLEQSRVLAAQVFAFRHVIAENQHKINYDSKGNLEFKHLNPAAVTRQVNEKFNAETEYKIRLVSLNPRVPEHKADSFEREALLAFQRAPEKMESWDIDIINGQRFFRYLVPSRIVPSCLYCHGGPRGDADVSGHIKEGYRVGEVAGALSITIPTKLKDTSLMASIGESIILTFLVLVLSATVIIFHTNLFVTKPVKHLADFSGELAKGNLTAQPTYSKTYGELQELTEHFTYMAYHLKRMYEELEVKVEERTKELAMANRELVKVSQYKTEFLANMSHELRTPLTAIIAFTEELLKQSQGQLTAEQEDYLKEIKDSGKQLLGLINDLLDLSKIESGKVNLDLTEVDLGDLISHELKLIAPLLEKKKLKIIIKLENKQLIVGDARQLGHVVRNILSNAVKFSPPGGQIEVSLKADIEAEGVLVKIRDEGPGISKEDRELIFDVFYQAEQGLNRSKPGTGLGLAMVKKIVDLHLGSVKIESEPGFGATFYLFLHVFPPLDRDLE